MEESLGLALLQIDLLKNKTTAGGLSKSIADIDVILNDIKGQRERMTSDKKSNPLILIATLIERVFDLEEMDDLIFAAGFRPEDIPAGKTARARAREIVEFFDKRQGQLDVLLMTLRNLRPGELWPE